MNVFRRLEANVPLMIMLAGLPGSGKSTVAESIHTSGDNEKYKPVIHSSDGLRKELFGDEATQGDNNKLFTELHKRIKADLIAGKDVIYDATNINKKLRRQFLNELRNISCTPICLCVMTSYETCLKNNEKRERKVPVEVIKRMQMNWQPPHYSEGFREIKYIFSNLDDEYADKFTIRDFFKVANDFDQENSHHALSLGEHCTKTRTNAKGIEDGNCHYYQHHCVGAYNIPFYLHYANQFTEEDFTYISNLIYYHMHPYCQWKQSEKALNKDKTILGDKLFKDIMLLHDADLYAH